MRHTILVTLSLISGCATYNGTVARAARDYDARKYDEALRELQDVDGHEGSLSDRWETRYKVYRGLAAFRVWRRTGDASMLTEARRFLLAGRRAYEHGDRNALQVAEERELSAAIEAAKEN